MRALVLALDDDARGAAPVGVFHLRFHAGVANVHLRADARLAQIARHFLIIAHPCFIHDKHDNGRNPYGGLRDFAQMGKGRIEPRYADGEAGRGNRLRAEARDESVVAAATAHGAEAHGLAVFIARGEGQFGLKHWPGIVFQATHHGRIEAYAVLLIACLAHKAHDRANRFVFGGLPGQKG